MLSSDDRSAIEGLFQRLAEAEQRGGPRDRDAEELIQRLIGRQPAAPYYLAQTVVVQQQALTEAERRIEELERQAERGREPARRGPWDHTPQYQNAGGYDAPYRGGYGLGSGGFLAGAAQTALGVAGGVLLGNMIGSMFSAGSAHAAEPQPQDNNGADDNSSDNGSDGGDAGGDGGGDFDVGGDF